MSKKVIYSIVGAIIVFELLLEVVLLVDSTREYKAEQINADDEVTVDLGTQSNEETTQDTVTENTQIEVLSDDEL